MCIQFVALDADILPLWPHRATAYDSRTCPYAPYGRIYTSLAPGGRHSRIPQLKTYKHNTQIIGKAEALILCSWSNANSKTSNKTEL